MTVPSGTLEVRGGDASAVLEFDDDKYFDEFDRLRQVLFEVTGKYSTRNVIENCDSDDERGTWWTVFGLTDAQAFQIKMLW